MINSPALDAAKTSSQSLLGQIHLTDRSIRQFQPFPSPIYYKRDKKDGKIRTTISLKIFERS